MNGFSWVLENEIGGMARPDPRDEAIWAWLVERNIGLVVSLTGASPDAGVLARHGLDLLHLPVADFTPPSRDAISEFLDKARFYQHEGKGIVVHCGAGIGRTGTMIACYLVDKGFDAEQAIQMVREARPGSIETPEQEQVIHDLAARRKE